MTVHILRLARETRRPEDQETRNGLWSLVHHRWIVVLLGLLIALGCTTYRRPRPDLPKDERGMAELSQLLRDLRRAIPAGELADAGEMADELEDGIARADAMTASHPDFGDLVAAAKRARAVYEDARRKHAAAQLMAAMQPMLDQGDQILEALVARGPTDDALDDLEEIIEDLGELREGGEEYIDVDRYYEFSVGLDQRFAVFVAEERKNRWLLAAHNQLDDILHDLIPAAKDGGFAKKIERAERNADTYDRCGEAVDELCSRDGFSPQLSMKTRLGLLTAPGVGALCAAHRDDARRRANSLRWERDVSVIAARANAAMEDVGRRGAPAARLRASERAIGTMTECASSLAGTEERVGYDPRVRLRSWTGPLSVPALRAGCAKEAERLRSQLPILNWRATFAQLQERVAEANRDRGTARAEPDPHRRQQLLGEALGGLDECDDRVVFLAKRRDPALAGAEPSKPEWLALEALRKSCVKNAARIRKLITKAETAVTRQKARARRKKKR